MAYNFLIETAIDTVRKRYSNGSSPQMGDTVCVVCSGSGKIYTGINIINNNRNFPENIHAEIDVINKMRADGENIVKAITVFNSCNVSPILPCNGCISLIISMNPENINAQIVTPSGNIRITDVGRAVSSPSGNQMYTNPGMQTGNSMYMNPGMQTGNSMYMNPGMQTGNSMYMNPGTQAGNSVYMNPGAAYGTHTTPAPQRKSYVSGAGQTNNILKNKLNNLFDDSE